MSLAWASLAIILLLLPGIFFFIGLATYDRLSREIIRSSVVSEVALALVLAGAIHFASISFLSAFGFRLSNFAASLAHVEQNPEAFARQFVDQLEPATIYLGCTTALGFLLGVFVAQLIVSGPLRVLARHKWIYDIVDADQKKVIITAYVMTTIIDQSRIIMYKGRLRDIFLGQEGNISYITLQNCSRYFMTFKEAELVTSKQLELFGSKRRDTSTSVWDQLLIEGGNIANVLFDTSREIKEEAEGQKALEQALKQILEQSGALRGRPERIKQPKGPLPSA